MFVLVLYDVDPEDLKVEIRGKEERSEGEKTSSRRRSISSVVHRPPEHGREEYTSRRYAKGNRWPRGGRLEKGRSEHHRSGYFGKGRDEREMSYRRRRSDQEREERQSKRSTETNEIEKLKEQVERLQKEIQRTDATKRINITVTNRDLCPNCRRRMNYRFYQNVSDSEWNSKNY